MAPKPRPRLAARRLPRDQRIAVIMEAARVVLREKGSEQFLTSDVAERCGVSEGTIYKYFPTKRDLLIQVAEAWFDEFLAEDYSSRSKGPIRDRMYQAVWWGMSIIRREPALTRFVLMELRSDPNYRSLRIYQQNREIVSRVMQVIEDGRTEGSLRDDVPRRVVRDMIFGAIEHQTWAYLRGEGDFSVDESAEGITDIMCRGLSVAHAPADTGLEAALARLERVTAQLAKQVDKAD